MSLMGTIAGPVLGAIYDQVTAKQKQRMQLKQHDEMRKRYSEDQKDLARFNAKLMEDKELRMFEATGADAIRKQYEKAGLSVGLMYGGSGAGGQLGGSSFGAGAMPGSAQEPQMGKGVEMGLQAAQANAGMKLVEAQTAKTEAETRKLEGVDTSEGQARIANLTQGIQNAKAQELLTNAQRAMEEIRVKEANMSQGDRMTMINKQTEIAIQQAEQAGNETDISNETIKDKIKIIKTEAIAGVLRNELTKGQTKLTEAQIEKIAAEITAMDSQQATNYRNSKTAEKQAEISEFEARIKEKLAIFDTSEANKARQTTGLISDIMRIIMMGGGIK